MAPASNPTATLILSALNANKASSFACSVLLQETESSSYLRVFVSAWTDTTLMPTTHVCPALQDAELADQLPTAQLAWLWLLPATMEPAPAPIKPTSPSLLTALDTALPVDSNA